MLTIEQLRNRSANEQRTMIKPTVVVQAKTPDEKREISRVAKQVIAEHYAVLAALKDR